MNEIKDEALMTMFCSGKTEAFQVLFEKYRNRIFRFIYVAYERNPSQAEDYTQEVFLRVIKNRESFNPSMRFSTWLYTIARNYCLNQLRAKTANFETLVDPMERLMYTDAQSDVSEKIIDKELGVLIRQSVAALPENLRVIFILREIDGLPHAGIAEIMNTTECNVRTRLHRAKKQLQAILLPYLEDKNEKHRR